MSDSPDLGPAKEFEAIQAIYEALEPLDEPGRQRVINYIISLFKTSAVTEPGEMAAEGAGTDRPKGGQILNFHSLAELYDAANPVTNAEKALVAGVWLQECLGNDSFSSQSVNTELKHLGHGIANITAALDQLKYARPAQVIQLRKSGASQQARKTYKVTMGGVRGVKAMIEKARTAGE
jgi:hypothetical protein